MNLHKIISYIIRGEEFDAAQNFSSFNQLIKDHVKSLEIYYKEVLAINPNIVQEIIDSDISRPIDEDSQQNLYIKSACLSVEDIKNLVDLVLNSTPEFDTRYPKIYDLATRLQNFNAQYKYFDPVHVFNEKAKYNLNQMYIFYMINQDSIQKLKTRYEDSYKIPSQFTEQQKLVTNFKNLIR